MNKNENQSQTKIKAVYIDFSKKKGLPQREIPE